MWYETDKNELVLGQMLCMEGAEKIPKLGKCHEMGGSQDWRHKRIVRFLERFVINLIANVFFFPQSVLEVLSWFIHKCLSV